MNVLYQVKRRYWAFREWLPKQPRQFMARCGRVNNFALHAARILGSSIKNFSQLTQRRYISWRTHKPLIAIALTEHIGDIVAAQPIARYLRERHPSGELLWVTRSPFAELVRSFGDIDRVIEVSCITEWAWLRNSGLFSIHYDLHVNHRPCPVCNIPITRRTGNPAIDTKNYYNYGNLLAVMCQNAGISVLDNGPVLHPPNEAITKVDKLHLPSAFIAIHTRSNEPSRDWMEAKWKELAERLIYTSSLSIVEIGLRPLVNMNSPRYVDLCGALSILETAEVVRRAVLFIGIDSGPAHLANAVGAPGVILKGTYRAFANYQPYSGSYGTEKNATIISAEGYTSTIPVDEVVAAVLARLEILGIVRSDLQSQ